MNTAKSCVFGLALFCLCGCTDSHYEMKQVPPQLSQAEMSRTDIVKVGYELADGLIKNLHAPLNEDVRALSKANNAACVVAGTFGRLGKSTVVSVRMIRASDNVILSSADGVLVRGR